MVLLTLFSYGPVSDGLLRPLENQYLPVNTAKMASDVKNSIKWIVVLGGGCTLDPRLPVTAQLSGASVDRLIEGVRLRREIPGCRMILSGGAIFGTALRSGAYGPGDAASRDGYQGSSCGTPFPGYRGAGGFHSPDCRPRPVHPRHYGFPHAPGPWGSSEKRVWTPLRPPTQFFASEAGGIRPGAFYPQADELAKSGVAIYEYVGTLWSMMRGRI